MSDRKADQMREENRAAFASVLDALRQANVLKFSDAEWQAYVTKHFGSGSKVFQQAFDTPRGDLPDWGNPHHNDPLDTIHGGGHGND